MSADWLIGCDGAHSIGAPRRRRAVHRRDDGQRLDAGRRPHEGLPVPGTRPRSTGTRTACLSSSRSRPAATGCIADMPPTDAAPRRRRRWSRCRPMIDRRGPGGMKAYRSDLAGRLPDQRPQGLRLSLGPRLPGRRRRPHPQPGRRPRHEHRHAGRLQPGLEAGAGGPRNVRETLLDSYSPERSDVGDQVLKTAQRLTVVGTMKNPVAQAVRNTGRPHHAGSGAGPARVRGHDDGSHDRLSQEPAEWPQPWGPWSSGGRPVLSSRRTRCRVGIWSRRRVLRCFPTRATRPNPLRSNSASSWNFGPVLNAGTSSSWSGLTAMWHVPALRSMN